MNLDKNIGINRIHIKLLVLFDKDYISFIALHFSHIARTLYFQFPYLSNKGMYVILFTFQQENLYSC